MAITDTPSYMPLATIDSFLDSHIDTTEKWNKLVTKLFTTLADQHKAYVLKAMDILEGQEWLGEKTDANQELEFPRDFTAIIKEGSYPYDDSYLRIANNRIPKQIENAELQIIRDLLTYDIRDYYEIRKGGAKNVALPGGLAVGVDLDKPVNEFWSDSAKELCKYYLRETITADQRKWLVRA